MRRFGLASKLSSTDATVQSNLDAYVQGVYARRIVMPTAVGQPDDERYEYIEAIDCLKLMKTLPGIKIQPAILDTLSGYLCPNIESYEL